MALSQRPASRFFAAFYRWTLHTHHPRPHAIVCRYHRNATCTPTSSHMRRYHATSPLRLRNPLEEKLSIDSSNLGGLSKEKLLDGETFARETLGEAVASELMLKDEGRAVEEVLESASIHPNSTTAKSHIEKQDTLVEPNEPEHGKVSLKDTVRTLLRKVPNSVAVITVRNFDPNLKRHVPMGVAVSSLASVTLDPPTISFNIKEPSKTLDAIRAANGRFRVHFPAADKGGADIVESFCQGNHPGAYQQRSRDLNIRMSSTKQDPITTESPAPQILNDSVRAAMECTLTHELPVADHVILAARVESLEMKTLNDPLMIYVDGRYMRAQTTVSTHGET